MDISLPKEIAEFKAAIFKNSGPMGQIICDPDMRIRDWCEQAGSILGYNGNEVTGQHFGVYIEEGCRSELLMLLEEHKAIEEHIITIPHVPFRKENKRIFCNWAVLVMRQENQTTGFLIFIEEVFNPSKLFYSAYSGRQFQMPPHTTFNLIFDNTINGFPYLSPDFASTIAPLIDLNSISATFFSHIAKQDRIRTIKHFRTNSHHNAQIDIAFHIHLNQGTTRKVKVNGHCINKDYAHLFVTHVKILNTPPANKRLGQKPQGQDFDHAFFEYGYRSQNELLGELTSGVLHELNQPIGLVQIILDNLKMKLQSGNLDTDYLENKLDLIRTSTTQINELINEVKIFRRDLKGSGTTFIDLNLPIKRMFDFFRVNLINNQIYLTLNLQPDLPPILGNNKWISTIITNLISNSVHSLNRKGKLRILYGFSKEIKVSTWLEDDQIILEFWDNGMGIKKKHLKLIFDPFFSTKSHEGNGIGLAIVKRYLEQIGAKIEAESAEREFASFRLTFPAIVKQNK